MSLILETADGIELAGEAADGAAGVQLCQELAPDVVLMDLRMPGMDGLTAIGLIRQQVPATAIIILTTYDEDDLMVRGLRAGARGFLLKDTDRATLLDAIRAAARGQTLLSPQVMQRVLAHTASPAPATDADGPLDLTEREREVLLAAAQGLRNKEIARDLGITERTVKAHLTSVYNKFGVDSRAAAIAVAAQRGLLPSG
ncbi:MAG: response regulator transcription factor [Caldilineales bacterium]